MKKTERKNRLSKICKVVDKRTYNWFNNCSQETQEDLLEIRKLFQGGETGCKTFKGMASAILEDIPEVKVHVKTLSEWLKG